MTKTVFVGFSDIAMASRAAAPEIVMMKMAAVHVTVESAETRPRGRVSLGKKGSMDGKTSPMIAGFSPVSTPPNHQVQVANMPLGRLPGTLLKTGTALMGIPLRPADYTTQGSDYG
jgi:hypothetical protein